MITKYEVLKSILEDIDHFEAGRYLRGKDEDSHIFYLARLGLIETCTIIVAGIVSENIIFLLED